MKHWNVDIHQIERSYQEALDTLEKWEKVEKERFLEDWEEEEKRNAERDANYYGDILVEEEEYSRCLICESQGLSRWG